MLSIKFCGWFIDEHDVSVLRAASSGTARRWPSPDTKRMVWLYEDGRFYVVHVTGGLLDHFKHEHAVKFSRFLRREVARYANKNR